MTDENSASASEILSGAIQDWDRGLVVGRRSFGKGLVQRPIELTDGSQIRLTVARYYTPCGRFIQKSYEDKEAYEMDLINRYENGEYTSRDSIQLPDSLKHKTLITNRTVYGGGGIMPDFFVPLDTTEISDMYSKIIRGGHMNTFCIDYANNHREALLANHSDFNGFKNNFEVDQKVIDALFEHAMTEDEKFEFIQEDFDTSEELIKLRIKASIANNLWGVSEFYQIYNKKNEILQTAIEIIESDKYKEANLAE